MSSSSALTTSLPPARRDETIKAIPQKQINKTRQPKFTSFLIRVSLSGEKCRGAVSYPGESVEKASRLPAAPSIHTRAGMKNMSKISRFWLSAQGAAYIKPLQVCGFEKRLC